jgi:hypothetical protein
MKEAAVQQMVHIPWFTRECDRTILFGANNTVVLGSKYLLQSGDIY